MPIDTSWQEFARVFGFNALLVLVLLYLVYKVANVYVLQVAKPLNDRLLMSIDHTDEAVDQQTETLRTILGTLQQLAASVALMNERIAKLERERDARPT